eukprot:COSAG01_NODE_2158_length_8251_cov_8.554645_12_plen_215_part_00
MPNAILDRADTTADDAMSAGRCGSWSKIQACSYNWGVTSMYDCLSACHTAPPVTPHRQLSGACQLRLDDDDDVDGDDVVTSRRCAPRVSEVARVCLRASSPWLPLPAPAAAACPEGSECHATAPGLIGSRLIGSRLASSVPSQHSAPPGAERESAAPTSTDTPRSTDTHLCGTLLGPGEGALVLLLRRELFCAQAGAEVGSRIDPREQQAADLV